MAVILQKCIMPLKRSNTSGQQPTGTKGTNQTFSKAHMVSVHEIFLLIRRIRNQYFQNPICRFHALEWQKSTTYKRLITRPYFNVSSVACATFFWYICYILKQPCYKGKSAI